jgi:hypothetical protein
VSGRFPGYFHQLCLTSARDEVEFRHGTTPPGEAARSQTEGAAELKEVPPKCRVGDDMPIENGITPVGDGHERGNEPPGAD